MTSPDCAHRAVDIKPYLLGAAPVYLDFLEQWHRHPALVADGVLHRIVERYAGRWLPLLAEWPTVELEPPADVHWAWHLHMLNPHLYADYCIRRFRRILPHKIRLSGTEERFALERAKLIWNDKYRDEPFELDLDRVGAGTYHRLPDASLSCIPNTAKTAWDFLRQVSLPHYRDTNFLFLALKRYRKFLALKSRRPRAKITVPVDVLLMWKVHALFPVEYYDEALRPCQLYTACTDVDQDGRCPERAGYYDGEWSALYDDPLLVPGSAYRGAPAGAALRPLAAHGSRDPSFDQCDITLDELSIGEIWSRDKNVVVVARLLGSTSVASREILRLDTAIHKVNRADDPGRGLVSFKFNTKENQAVEFDVYAVRGRCGCGRTEVHLNTLSFNPREPFEHGHFTTRDFLHEVARVSRLDPKVSFRCRLRAAAPEPHVLGLIRSPFEPAGRLPAVLQPFVCALPKWRRAMEAMESKEGDKTELKIANHELKSRDGTLDFVVQAIKQYDLDLSAVLVYHGDSRLVALAHSVGDETIASPNQLTGACPLSLDLDADELAMSISNHEGEWAICKGRWAYRNGGSGVRMSVFYLNVRKKLDFDIRDDEMQTIQFADVSVDMPSGRVSVDSRSRAVAENVALAFCVGIIYVSCQMRATVMATSRQNSMANRVKGAGQNGSVCSLKSASELSSSDLDGGMNPSRSLSRFTARRRNRKVSRRRKMSASYTFLLASGLLIDLALHGSTKNSLPSTHASLASLHLLYSQSEKVTDDTGLLDTRNNNYPGANQHPSITWNGYRNQQAELSLTPSKLLNGSLRHDSIQVGSFIGRESEEGDQCVDVRL